MGAEGDAVLGLLVDLLLRVVRAEVALAAVLRLARLGGGEVVALWQAVQEPREPSRLSRPMPVLGQPVGRQRAVFVDLDHAAVALLAAVDGERRAAVEVRVALDDVGQEVVERAQDQPGLGVVALVELRRPPARGSARSPWARR